MNGGRIRLGFLVERVNKLVVELGPLREAHRRYLELLKIESDLEREKSELEAWALRMAKEGGRKDSGSE